MSAIDYFWAYTVKPKIEEIWLQIRYRREDAEAADRKRQEEIRALERRVRSLEASIQRLEASTKKD